MVTAIAPLDANSLSRYQTAPDMVAIFRSLVASADPEHWCPVDTHLFEAYGVSD